MANKDLNILIKAKLDTSESQVSALNNQIKELQSKLTEMNLNVKVDDTEIKKVTDNIKNAQKEINKGAENTNVISFKNYQKNANEFVNFSKDVVAKIKREYQNMFPDATITTTAFKNAKEQLQSFVLDIKKANGEAQKLSFDSVKVQNESGKGATKKFRLTDITDVDAQMAMLKRVQEQQDKLIANAEKLSRTSQITPSELNSFIKAPKARTMDDVNELKAEFNLIKELTSEMNNMQNAINKIRESEIVPQGLDQLENSLKSMSTGNMNDISTMQERIDLMKQLHNEMVQADKDDQKLAETIAKAQREMEVSQYKSQQAFEGQKQKVLTNAMNNLDPSVISQQSYDFVSGSIINAQTIQQLNDAKILYEDMLKDQKENLDLAKQIARAEADAYAEEAKRVEAMDKLIARAQAENKARDARETQRVGNLGQKMDVSPVTNQHINVPQNWGDMDAMKAYVAQVYKVDESLVSMKQTMNESGQMVYKFQVDLQTGRDTFTRLAGNIDQATNALYRYSETIRNTPNRNLNIFEKAKNAFEGQVSMMMSNAIFTGVSEAASNFRESLLMLDTQLNQLKRAMQDTQPGTDFNAMLQSGINMASELGNKVEDVNKIMVGFANAGRFTQQQVMELTKTATIASNITGMSGDESSNALHTIMNSFKLDTSQVMDVVDKMANVSRNFAISSGDIANGMAKAGAAAQTYGVDIDHLNGYMTAIAQTTRESGNIVGNSLKTIFSRLDTKASINALQQVGIEVKNVDGTVRSAQDVIDDLGAKWKTLDATEQQHIGVSVAGRYQLTRFLALMNDFGVAQNAVKDSMTASGSAMQENNIYNQSLQASYNKLNNSFVNLANSTGGFTTILKFMIGSVTAIVNGLAQFNSGVGAWVMGATVAVGVAIALTKAVLAIKDAFYAAEIAARGFKMVLGTIGLVLTAFDLIASSVMGAQDQVQQTSADMYQKALDTGSQADKLNVLIDQYTNLKSATDTTKDSQDQLNKVFQEILRISPSVASALADQNGKLDENAKKAKEYADSLKNLSIQQAKVALEANLAEQNDAQSKLDKDNAIIGTNKQSYEDASKQLEQFVEKYKNYGATSISNITSAIQKSFMDSTGQGLMVASEDLNKVNDLISKINNNSDTGKAYTDLTEQQKRKDDLEQQRKSLEDFINGNKKATDSTKIAVEWGKSLGDTAKQTAGDITNEAGAAGDAASATETFDKSVQDAMDTTSQAGSQVVVFNGTLQAMAEQYDNVKKNIEDYNKLLSDVSNGNKLNSDQVLDLIAKHGDLMSAISFENGQLTINKKAVQELRDAQIAKAIDAATAENSELSTLKESLQGKLTAYGVEISAITDLASAKQALTDMDKKSPANDMHASTVSGAQDDFNNSRDQLQKLADFYQKVDNLKNMMKTGLTEAGLDGSGSGGAKDAVDDLTKSLDGLNAKIKEEQDLLNKYPQSSQEYRNVLQEQIALIKQKDALLEKELKNPTAYTYGDTSSGGKGGGTVVSYSGGSDGADVNSIMVKYGDIINANAEEYKIPAHLIAAMIMQESSGNSDAISKDGGYGLMQLTSQEYVDRANLNGGWNDPSANIEAGVWALKQKIKDAGGNLKNGLIDYNGSSQYFNDVIKHMSASDVEAIFGNSGGVNDGSGNQIGKSAKNLYDAQKKIKDQLASDAQEIAKIQKQIVDSVLAHYDEWQKDQDQALQKSQNAMKNYSVGSKQYIAEQQNQISILEAKQQRLHMEADVMRNSGITTDEYRNKIRDLGIQWMQLQQQISQTRFDMVNAQMQTYTNSIARLSQQIDASKGRQNLLNTDTSYGENYKNVTKSNQEIVKQITLYKETANVIHDQTDAMRAQLATGQLNAEQADEIQQKIIANQKAYFDAMSSAKSLEDQLLKQQEALADQIVSIAKQRIQDEKDAYDKSMSDKEQADQDAHDKKMKQMDDEKKKQDDFFDAQKQALSRNNTTTDYNEQLAQKEKDRKKLQDEMNNLSLDNSTEGVAKKKDLQEQLDKADADIAKMKRDRDVQVRSDAIDDAKKAYDDQYDLQKQSDEESFKQQKESDQKKKEEQDKAYQDQLNDEKHWADLKKEVIDGNYGDIEKILNNFQSYYDQHMKELGQTTYNNFTHALEQAKEAMQSLQDSVTGGSGGIGAGTANGADQQTTDAANKGTMLTKGDGLTSGHFEIGKNGAIMGARQLAAIIGLQDKDIAWDDSNVILQGHKFAPQASRNGYNLISVRDFANAFGLQLKWNDVGGGNQTIQLYHDGGVIGDKPTNKLTDIANKMFNANSNEQVVKALKGELMIPPQNIAKNFIPNLGKLISDIGSQIVNTGDTNYHLNINIEKIGSKSDADYATKRIVDEVKKLGRVVKS